MYRYKLEAIQFLGTLIDKRRMSPARRKYVFDKAQSGDPDDDPTLDYSVRENTFESVLKPHSTSR